ncbi:MAG: hypothetical protein AAFN07_16185 [Pseudomonadota bacterium]
MSPLDFLEVQMMDRGCSPTRAEWRRVCEHARERRISSRDPVYNDVEIADRWFLISSGTAGSYYTHENGRVTLTRFFEAGHIAGNVSSTWTQDYGTDRLMAISDLDGVEFSHEFLLNEYLTGRQFGQYIRMKVVETLQYDKDLLVCQSLNDADALMNFLAARHTSVFEHALKKDIAAFLGITPQAYSRILRRREHT